MSLSQQAQGRTAVQTQIYVITLVVSATVSHLLNDGGVQVAYQQLTAMAAKMLPAAAMAERAYVRNPGLCPYLPQTRMHGLKTAFNVMYGCQLERRLMVDGLSLFSFV